MTIELATRPTAASHRSAIMCMMEDVAREQKKNLAPITDDLVLIESGLDSLCFALIVARLEDSLGLDPFTASDDMRFPVTFGDFVALYDNAG